MYTLTKREHIRTRSILLLLLLPAILWLFFNTTANRHIHVLSNGYVISHAHPFVKNHQDPDAFPLDDPSALPLDDPSALPSHQHTNKELLLLSLFSEFLFSIITLIITRPLIHAFPQITRSRFTHPEPARQYYHVHHYHAPPACR